MVTEAEWGKFDRRIASWAEKAAVKVYCVMCIDEDDAGCCVHIFSTQKKADAFAASDPRPHVLYDYVIDHPERMEQAAQ